MIKASKPPPKPKAPKRSMPEPDLQGPPKRQRSDEARTFTKMKRLEIKSEYIMDADEAGHVIPQNVVDDLSALLKGWTSGVTKKSEFGKRKKKVTKRSLKQLTKDMKYLMTC